MIKIVIADDHKIFREGLKMLLEENKEIKVIGEAANGKELLTLLESIKPDIIFMDIKMPELNGFDASKIILKKYPDIKIITLTMFGDEQYFEEMINTGVKSFILKDSDTEELLLAVNAVLRDKDYVSQELLQKLARKNGRKPDANIPSLTKREKEVLQYMVKGYTNKEIADILFLSKRTIERHRAKLLEKTMTKNSISLITYAIRNSLINIDLLDGELN